MGANSMGVNSPWGETGINPYKHRDCTVTARFKTYGNLNEKKD